MVQARQVVITGVGVVSPIGIGTEEFWQSLMEGRSGVRRLDIFDGTDLPVALAAVVENLNAAKYVRPRKALKVMSRDIQLAFVAAELACQQAGVGPGKVDPERLGIVFGADMITCELDELVPAYRQCMVDGRFCFDRWGNHAMGDLFPLWMLKYLPNMPACHVGIAQDARGPNNSLVMGEISSLAALAEATRVIERGQADIMIAGGCGCRTHSAVWARDAVYRPTHRDGDPARACRPFDLHRDGMVHGEGAAVFVLEEAEHAQQRGVKPLARIVSFAARFEPHPKNQPVQGKAIRAAIEQVLTQAGIGPDQVGHVNAHGLSTKWDDIIEAQAIRAVLGDVPVTAPKSFFGNLAAGSGAVEMVASVLALQRGAVPFTLNYETPDPQCPVNVIAEKPAPLGPPTALLLNHNQTGQAMAMLIALPEWQP